MKAGEDSKSFWVFKDLHENLLTRGINPAYMRMENEASTAFQRERKPKDINFQLALPVMNHRNTDERAISTFKDNFIARICSIDPDFPMKTGTSS